MPVTLRYDEVLDAIDSLPAAQQEELVEIVRHRLSARRREQILSDVAEGRAACERGEARVMTVEEIRREVGS